MRRRFESVLEKTTVILKPRKKNVRTKENPVVTYEKMIYSNRIHSSSVTKYINITPSSGTRFTIQFFSLLLVFFFTISYILTRYQLYFLFYVTRYSIYKRLQLII